MAVRGHEQNPTDSMDYPHTLPQPSLQQVVHANTVATNTWRNPALLKKPLTKIVYRDTMIREHCLEHNSSFETVHQLSRHAKKLGCFICLPCTSFGLPTARSLLSAHCKTSIRASQHTARQVAELEIIESPALCATHMHIYGRPFRYRCWPL